MKCRASGLTPDVAVVVTTVRSLKAHTGRYRIVAGRPLPEELLAERPEDVAEWGSNLAKQLANVQRHGVPAVVAINVFPDDHESELVAIEKIAAAAGVASARCTNFVDGACGHPGQRRGRGGNHTRRIPVPVPVRGLARDKIRAVATQIYGAADVTYSKRAETQLDRYEWLGFGDANVHREDPPLVEFRRSLKGAPVGWTLPVDEVRLSAGAGFVYPICGSMATMPGLGSSPAAHRIDVDANGEIVGLS
ncbi:MAG: formate--tetrahydrofolate ligase [Ilumatobacteraceae bacterium]